MVLSLLCIVTSTLSSDEVVQFSRVPDSGIQPQVILGPDQTVHLLSFHGDPAAGNLHYRTRSRKGTWSEPKQIDPSEGTAIAIGTIRGGQFALGRSGVIHVVWNGSGKARKQGEESPLLYSRLDPVSHQFEPVRNLIQNAYGLDGGSTLAADKNGNVYVIWQAKGEKQGEEHRRLFLAHSGNDGSSFSAERPIFRNNTGICACCSMLAETDPDGNLMVMYRGVKERSSRNVYLIKSKDQGMTFESEMFDQWNINNCPMSSFGLLLSESASLAAWETEGKIRLASLKDDSMTIYKPNGGNNCKHPRLALGTDGKILVVWTEGTSWGKGGNIAWQLYDKEGKPTRVRGRKEGLPVWSFATPLALPDGQFEIIY